MGNDKKNNETQDLKELSATMRRALTDLQEVEDILLKLSGKDRKRLVTFLTPQEAFDHEL